MALSRVDAPLWLRSAHVARETVAPLGTPDPGGTTEAVFQVPLLLGARQIARTAEYVRGACNRRQPVDNGIVNGAGRRRSSASDDSAFGIYDGDCCTRPVSLPDYQR